MPSLFAVAVAEARVEDIQAFLATADDETLVWEAKADGKDSLRPEHVIKSVSAFANQIGGTLIIGAQRENNAWQLPGVAKAVNGEPSLA